MTHSLSHPVDINPLINKYDQLRKLNARNNQTYLTVYLPEIYRVSNLNLRICSFHESMLIGLHVLLLGKK